MSKCEQRLFDFVGYPSMFMYDTLDSRLKQTDIDRICGSILNIKTHITCSWSTRSLVVSRAFTLETTVTEILTGRDQQPYLTVTKTVNDRKATSIRNRVISHILIMRH